LGVDGLDLFVADAQDAASSAAPSPRSSALPNVSPGISLATSGVQRGPADEESDLEEILRTTPPDDAAKTAEEELQRMWGDLGTPLSQAPPTQKELDLKTAMTEGFHLRDSWIGQKWEREKRASLELRQEYFACVTPETKQEYRQR
jgi:hypothetical protein